MSIAHEVSHMEPYTHADTLNKHLVLKDVSTSTSHRRGPQQ
jgi:hypothetical protein